MSDAGAAEPSRTWYYFATRLEALKVMQDGRIEAKPLGGPPGSGSGEADTPGAEARSERSTWPPVVCLTDVARTTAPPLGNGAPQVIRFAVWTSVEPLQRWARRQPVPAEPRLHRYRSNAGTTTRWYVHEGSIDLQEIGEVLDLMEGRRMYLDTPVGRTLRRKAAQSVGAD